MPAVIKRNDSKRSVKGRKERRKSVEHDEHARSSSRRVGCDPFVCETEFTRRLCRAADNPAIVDRLMSGIRPVDPTDFIVVPPFCSRGMILSRL